ncbi:MAG: hypothetical protein HIU89_09110 [Proteobacteria bacterium]|nr:hypothetical protein [Pseudomonadota bacterium]
MNSESAGLLEACLCTDPTAGEAALRAFLVLEGAERLNRFASGIDGHLSQLPTMAIAHLVRLFTRLEMAGPPQFCGGSTARVPLLLNELATRDAALADELSAWVLHATCNPYVPFGKASNTRAAAESVLEYRQLRGQRGAEPVAMEERMSAVAKEQAALRAEEHTRQRQVHTWQNEARKRQLGALNVLDATSRLQAIALDEDHPIGFYPSEWADLAAAMQLLPETQKTLLTRLPHAPKGPWRDLGEAIHGEFRRAG